MTQSVHVPLMTSTITGTVAAHSPRTTMVKTMIARTRRDDTKSATKSTDVMARSLFVANESKY
jgi:hypothetical protein